MNFNTKNSSTLVDNLYLGRVGHRIHAQNKIKFNGHEVFAFYTTTPEDSTIKTFFTPVIIGYDDAFDIISTEMPETEFKDIHAEIKASVLKEFSSMYSEIQNMDDLKLLHSAIIENTPSIEDFLDQDILTDDPSDYEVNDMEDGSTLIPKRISESNVIPGEWQKQ